jgi:anti-anti-sigma factor
MDITHHPGTDWLELRLTGRLDTTWAEHVSDTIESAVRAGAHQIVLNFEQVDYISSLGIRVLLDHYKRLKAVQGSLSVSQPSEATLTILKATGLANVLIIDTVTATAAAASTVVSVVRGTTSYQVYSQQVATPLRCMSIGRPDQLAGAGYEARDCHSMVFPQGTFGLGLGAFGNGFADCQDRFGEFLAAGGCAITLPTNDPNALPDYVVEEGSHVPCVETLYALVGDGDFPTMIRFDTHADGPGTIGLTELVDMMLEFSAGESMAFVVLAEAAGLVGASLRRSPAAGPLSFELPEVRDCLAFSTERVGDRNLALLVGVASRSTLEPTSGFLRPLGTGSDVQAHVHAALFPYRPVQQGELPFASTLAGVLATSTPSAVMHLMGDTRPFEGVGETEIVRGACWVGALESIATQ